MNKPQKLIPRLARLLKVPEQDILDFCSTRKSEADWTKPCIEGPPRIWHHGRPQPAGRVMYEAVYGEPIPADMRSRRVCMMPECAQPHHFAYQHRYTLADFEPKREPQPEQPSADAISEAADFILSVDDWQTMSADALFEEFYGVHPFPAIQAALDTLNGLRPLGPPT